ncbi:capsular polysaccharide biosynthesis protein [Granulosicoccus antarcticus]|uniref:Capsule polysaccharide biosynthesis protein n=1 Tax=Granulosicoccus antarcticus IMCC3135 TaxID=1192854 RepID=A0A2Z2NKL6_9GAMM|nr:capsular polysaccharide biosynthesis protein [Granulosicoccus antarcticus]ASJ71683.1 hypothetical protein IMCC3135_07900 [Granulosicoccus antarcticus IMCC3135]
MSARHEVGVVSGESKLRHAVAFSSGIRAIRNIGRFLDVDSVISPFGARKKRRQLSCVVVWGRKQNAKRALHYAESQGLKVRYIEDGWIRTSSRDAHSRCCYSLLVDDTGVYYDSENPSDIENYLNLPDVEFATVCDEGDLEYARKNRERMVQHCITKYNFCPKPEDAILISDGKPLVLVIDQTKDDASVRFGGMQGGDFPAMLDRAIAENPGARVVVRTHPDVVAGRREGYLGEYAKQLGIEVSATGDNPMYWLKKAQRVYVGTSQLGFEALMCGCQVSVAGLPFYAGWGLTDDHLTLARRVRTRTLDQIFHASHVYLARYRDPVSGVQWRLHECIDHVQVQLEAFERNAHSFACIGITPWKRGIIAQYLRSPDGNIRFSKASELRLDEKAVYWSYSDSKSVADCPNTNEISRIEDGFIRSRGLGSNFVLPASLVVDHGGLYFDPASDSDLEVMLNTFDCTNEHIERSVRLRQSLLETRLTKYNVESRAVTMSGSEVKTHEDKERGSLQVLVVGQVEDDQSIMRGCVGVASNGALCKAVRSARPDAYIVYKPHPDVESGNRKGAVAPHILNECVNRVEHQRNFLNCLEECDELHTMTSLSGFEALLRGKAVHTYGMPFYAGWGLTQDNVKFQKRNRCRTLEELIYLCLVAYPRYLDIVSGEFITVEQLISSLADVVSNSESGDSSSMSLWKKLGNIHKAVNYKPI